MNTERGPEGREGPVGREGVAGREGLPGEPGGTGKTGQTGPTGKTGRALPKNVRWAFIILTLVFTGMVVAMGAFAVENRKRADEGKSAHDALCVIKANFIVREQRTVEFLEKNPGETILGLPRREFERSLADARETLRALETLICVPLPTPTTEGIR